MIRSPLPTISLHQIRRFHLDAVLDLRGITMLRGDQPPKWWNMDWKSPINHKENGHLGGTPAFNFRESSWFGKMFYKLRIKHPPTKLQVFSSSIFSWMIREMIQIDSYLRGLSWHDCHCLEEPGLNYTQGCDLRRLEDWKTCTRKFVIIQLRHVQESHQSSST